MSKFTSHFDLTVHILFAVFVLFQLKEHTRIINVNVPSISKSASYVYKVNVFTSMDMMMYKLPSFKLYHLLRKMLLLSVTPSNPIPSHPTYLPQLKPCSLEAYGGGARGDLNLITRKDRKR